MNLEQTFKDFTFTNIGVDVITKPITTTIMEEEFCYVCCTCGKDGPYQFDEAIYPKGWKYDKHRGLNCGRCK